MNVQPARILLIDDDEVQFTLVRRYLKRTPGAPYEVSWVSTCEAALDITAQEEFAACLLDYQLGARTGLELLEDLRERGFDTPVILLTGRASFELDIDAMARGVSDFLDKADLTPVLLERSLRYTIENHRARKELERVNRELEQSLRRIEEDQEAARRIQCQLMPESHQSQDGYHFAYFVSTSARLSGDFVDYFRIDDEHLGVYIADVSGHGVSSAMVTVLLKSTISRLLKQYHQQHDDTILHPDRLLAALNEMLLEEKVDKYLTIFYFVFSEKTRSIAYSNAGHFPFPILLEETTPRFLRSKNLPVGLFPNATYPATVLALPDAFVLAMFSDGVLDVLDCEPLEEKEALLLSLVRSMDVCIPVLVEQLGLNTLGEPIDDITVLIMKKGT